MKERELKELGEALVREISTKITPKKLVKAVQKAHPEATKKQIVRAVFYALIAGKSPGQHGSGTRSLYLNPGE
ncbi:hypothetical protein ASC97_06965 [Rhizobium sp. Root1203]|uniref:hypothetical protein n=1 Tax=Rhizobium sp. Root1203 TaxID=1736427 RepID=UPI00070D65C5|nr:hypothetical protein [Rhizobium sp. Root1203]KQV28082.1 hypothetical protein ASC97_06965 [Rhizobium sp. Root1203]